MIGAPFEKKKAGLPAFLAAIAGALTPRQFRQELHVELVSKCTKVLTTALTPHGRYVSRDRGQCAHKAAFAERHGGVRLR